MEQAERSQRRWRSSKRFCYVGNNKKAYNTKPKHTPLGVLIVKPFSPYLLHRGRDPQTKAAQMKGRKCNASSAVHHLAEMRSSTLCNVLFVEGRKEEVEKETKANSPYTPPQARTHRHFTMLRYADVGPQQGVTRDFYLCLLTATSSFLLKNKRKRHRERPVAKQPASEASAAEPCCLFPYFSTKKRKLQSKTQVKVPSYSLLWAFGLAFTAATAAVVLLQALSLGVAVCVRRLNQTKPNQKLKTQQKK